MEIGRRERQEWQGNKSVGVVRVHSERQLHIRLLIDPWRFLIQLPRLLTQTLSTSPPRTGRDGEGGEAITMWHSWCRPLTRDTRQVNPRKGRRLEAKARESSGEPEPMDLLHVTFASAPRHEVSEEVCQGSS